MDFTSYIHNDTLHAVIMDLYISYLEGGDKERSEIKQIIADCLNRKVRWSVVYDDMHPAVKLVYNEIIYYEQRSHISDNQTKKSVVERLNSLPTNEIPRMFKDRIARLGRSFSSDRFFLKDNGL